MMFLLIYRQYIPKAAIFDVEHGDKFTIETKKKDLKTHGIGR